MLGVLSPVEEDRARGLTLQPLNIGKAYVEGHIDIVVSHGALGEIAERQFVFRAVPHLLRVGQSPVRVPVDLHLDDCGGGAGGKGDLMLVRPRDGAELTDKVVAFGVSVLSWVWPEVAKKRVKLLGEFPKVSFKVRSGVGPRIVEDPAFLGGLPTENPGGGDGRLIEGVPEVVHDVGSELPKDGRDIGSEPQSMG